MDNDDGSSGATVRRLLRLPVRLYQRRLVRSRAGEMGAGGAKCAGACRVTQTAAYPDLLQSSRLQSSLKGAVAQVP